MLENCGIKTMLLTGTVVTVEHPQTSILLYCGKLDENTLILSLLFMRFVLYINQGVII
jgi:hypothetical protein